MNYRKDRYGNDISILGYGCMRFTQTAGRINKEKAEREIMAAYHAGVNYYDTAYVYPGSEKVLGEILAKNQIRDKVSIATKLPHYLIKNEGSMDKYFDEQLSRLQTDYIDYYLMHMLTDVKTWERLKGLGIVEWLKNKKESGAIRQIGFSYHGNSDMFCRLVDVYDWDFCQIQYNYMDEHSQAGRTGLRYAHKKGLPVIIMVEENTASASEAQVGELGESEENMLSQVVDAINEGVKVGCTGCRYCMPCPQNVDIPGTFAAYNRRYSEGWFSAEKEYLMCTALRSTSSAASNCIGCGKCEQHCPQNIEIRKELVNARRKLEGPAYKIARKIIKWLRAY